VAKAITDTQITGSRGERYVGDLVEEMGYLCTRRESSKGVSTGGSNCATTSPYPPASVVRELKAGDEVAWVIHRGGEPIAVLVEDQGL
jgi:hypothetical protein